MPRIVLGLRVFLAGFNENRYFVETGNKITSSPISNPNEMCLKLFYTVMESCGNLVYHEIKEQGLCFTREGARQDGGAGGTPVTRVVHGTFGSIVGATCGHKEQLNKNLEVLVPSTPAAALGLDRAFLQCLKGAYSKDRERLLE